MSRVGGRGCGCGGDGAWCLLQPLTRLSGLISAVLLSGAGAELLVLGYSVAPLLIAGAMMVLVLETLWVVALFVDVLARRGSYSPALRFWDLARVVCRRVRAPLYACAATALLIIRPTTLTAGAGAALLVTALLRAVTPLSPIMPRSPRAAGSSLLSRLDANDVYFDTAPASYDPELDDKSEELTVLEVTDRASAASPPQSARALLDL